MATTWLILILLAIAAVGYPLARRRALASAGGDTRALHSRPVHYGFNAVVATLTPALGLIVIWLIVQPLVVQFAVGALIPSGVTENPEVRGEVLSNAREIAQGIDFAVAEGTLSREIAGDLDADPQALIAGLAEAGVSVGEDTQTYLLRAAQRMRTFEATGGLAMTVLALVAAAAGFVHAMRSSRKDFRARNSVERVMILLLALAASIAILTTVGIVLSMISETLRFFQFYPWWRFFFGLEWSPQFFGGSELGLLPLLWGTLYVSFVALLFAVPVGLFAAIYLSEFASRRVRSVAKPLIEVLAGIPTIVYGLFALITVGPLLRDYFAQPLGLGNSGSSVMTAGLVMGMLLIPFVSSLSDDAISAVPQSLRDGSLAVGATYSETVKRVILPAALPGIVGAVLLAASRAIGETMIVVLGAGASAQLDLNPFEAMTTVTVKIVGQLTGDTDFSSPETLVAFALGFTLFIITLGLNVLALYIVRRFREQYE